MYVVLANEIADVDVAEFEKLGSFVPEVIAVPNIDISLSLKGTRATNLDKIEDCQNTLSLSFEAPWDDADAEDQLFDDPFTAGVIYRRGERDFVELKYEYSLGVLKLHVYFLVNANECYFGYRDKEDEIHAGISYVDLWKEGFVIRALS